MAVEAHAVPADTGVGRLSEPFDEGLVELYRSYAAELLQMLWACVGDRATAEDLVHESFIRVHRSSARFANGRASRAYLRSTAFNLARSGFRRNVVALRHRPGRPDTASSPESDLMLSEDRREVATAIRALPTRQRQCIVLRYWGDLGDHEISDELGISVNSVKTHLRRAMAGMVEQLEKRS